MIDLSNLLPLFRKDLLAEIAQNSSVHSFEENTEILRKGQYVKVIPVVIKGLVKVFTEYNEKELLLYYIKPSESCVMSFAVSLKNEPSNVFAITEEPTEILLLPVDKLLKWVKNYPEMNALFFQQYNLRYSELLETINHLLFDKMDKRLLLFLKERVRLTHKNPLKITHKQIANELGTAREVVSRVLKKLEHENAIKQHSNSIEIL